MTDGSVNSSLKRGNTTYCVLGWYPNGQSDVRLISAKGKVILCETEQHAKDCLQFMSGGRLAMWRKDHVYYQPIEKNAINHACVITGYDPYDLPPNAPVPSETHLKGWKNHVLHWLVFHDCGQLEVHEDGSFINHAIE